MTEKEILIQLGRTYDDADNIIPLKDMFTIQ